MATIEDIKNFDDWDYYRLKTRLQYRGVIYDKCAIATEPMIFSNLHAVILIADDLTFVEMPASGRRVIFNGNLEEVSLKNIVFGKD